MISFIFQGPYFSRKGSTTADFALKVRELNPDCEIIFSTWEGEKIGNEKAFDRIIYNKDPGVSGINRNGKSINADRQIFSTCCGLKAASYDYCVKLRSDCVLLKPNLKSMFEIQLNDFSIRDENKGVAIFKQKVIASTVTSKFPKTSSDPCFHISDWFFAGLKEDLLDMLDIISFKEAAYDESNITVAPEQHIVISWLKKHNFWNQKYMQSIVKHQEVLHNNFILMSYSELGLMCHKFGYHLPIGSNGFVSYTKYDFVKEYLSFFNVVDRHEVSRFSGFKNELGKQFHKLRFQLIRILIHIRRGFLKR